MALPFFVIVPIAQANDFSFTKYSGNPIIQPGSAGSWDATWVLDPNVIKESDGNYKMWYLGWDTGFVHSGIGYATSTDGINWTKYSGNPVMTAGSGGSWDAYLWEARVIKDGSSYKMWYQAATTGSGPFKTGYATSPDGITWTKYSGNPVLSGTAGKWDQDYVGMRSVIKVDSTYYGWYEANTGSSKFAVGFATSPDGINWTKVSTDTPVLQGDSGAWDDANLVPNVIQLNGLYVMFYATRTTTAQIGIATSSDGQNWTKYSGNPAFNMLGTSGLWDSKSGTTLVSVIQDSTTPQNFLLYYRGLNSVYQIGLITLTAAVPSFIDPASSTSSSSSSTSSSWSPPSCTDPLPNGNPDLFQANVYSNSATLYFSPALNPVTYYSVNYGYAANSFLWGDMFSQGYSSGVLSRTINQLAPNTTYNFEIAAGNGCVLGNYSNSLMIKTQRQGASTVKIFYRPAVKS